MELGPTLYHTLRNDLIEGQYKIFPEGKSLIQRGFRVGEFEPQKVYLDVAVDPDAKYGYVFTIDPNNPESAMVKIGGGNRLDQRLVHTTHMFAMNFFGFERESVSKEDFHKGDIVYVGADYSEKIGVVTGISEDIINKVQVELPHKYGGATICWIKIEYLLKTGCYLKSEGVIKIEHLLKTGYLPETLYTQVNSNNP